MNLSKESYYSLKGLRLLLIDDDHGLLNSMKFYFEDHDCEVFASTSGEEGLKLFYENRPEVVLVDLNMPGVDGHNIVSHISRNFPDTPIIVVSGTGLIKEAIRSINLGAWDFITKPILNFEELEMSILRALEKKDLIIENKNYKENLEFLVVERTNELKKKSEKLENLVAELKLAKDAAEKSNRLKTEFLAQISHEIRTPLTAIMSYIGLLESDLKDKLTPDMADSFSVIESSSERIIRTIELILNMSELQLGAYEPLMKEFDIAETIDNILSLYMKKIEDKKLLLEKNIESSLPPVKLDKYSFIQIISNILDNAYKFTPAGKIRISAYSTKGRIYIEVEDTGVGIDSEYMERIFEAFSQEEQGYTRRYDGNGLGLALTKKYCELNNMEIFLESRKNEGTKVTVVI